jgi:hypothetical protein
MRFSYETQVFYETANDLLEDLRPVVESLVEREGRTQNSRAVP